MIKDNPDDVYAIFSDFEPVGWNPDDGDDDCGLIYSLRRDHGVNGTYRLHNPNDEINDNRPSLDKIVLEYRICHISYPLFTTGDMLRSGYMFEPGAEGNLIGNIAERISRRITKYWLKHYSQHGKTGGIFDRRFNPKDRDDFVIAHSGEYILKIMKYPNCIILKKTGRGKFGYESIKERDGLFDYRYFLQRQILVLESKVEKVAINVDDLLKNLFKPLRELFPHARFTYLLFTDKNSIYQRKNFSRRRQIKYFPMRIYRHLYNEGISMLFFSFNESRDDFERMKDHLITQYRVLHKMGVALHGKTVITDKELIVFDGGETPHLKLVKDNSTGLWREVKLTHKKNRK
ncbi:MAG TPA: hypothetical protein DCO75_01425 [Fibrobacteres bacterium]|nr:hypothetical protein [Fibrobacterota bacterium]